MRILVMAAGAVGGYFGSLLARAGNDVLFIARGDNLEAIGQHGLRVKSVTSGSFIVPVAASDRIDSSWTADLVLFCVKGYQNAVAIETIRPAVGKSTAVLTLQNGLGSGDELAEGIGADHVLLGAAYVDAAHPAPGVYEEHGGACRIVFAELDGTASARCSKLAGTFADSGIECEVADDIQQALWNKLVYICGLSGMTCITRSRFAEVMDTPETAELTLAVVREVAAVGTAVGVNLGDDVVERTMSILRGDKDHLLSSMHADLMAGRPLEVGNLNGRVSQLGRDYGVPTPVNDLIAACLTPAHNRAVVRTL